MNGFIYTFTKIFEQAVICIHTCVARGKPENAMGLIAVGDILKTVFQSMNIQSWLALKIEPEIGRLVP